MSGRRIRIRSVNRILRDRAAIADPKIRHRFYKNGTDVSKITSDVDPVNWHVVAQDRTTWKATMLIDVPTNPARHHKNLECT